MAEQRIISGGKPDPDPTLLTTQSLLREIGNLKELLEARLTAADASGRALHELISAKIEVLESVTSQRFSSIETQFEERDKRTEQLSLADKTAIAAALQAQKEAAGAQNESNAASVTKQEAAFTKLLDQNQTLFQTAMSALTTQLNDVKSRLDKGEGVSKGGSDSWAIIIGMAVIGTMLVGTIGLIVHWH
jgi:hypothetical protein